MDGDTSSGPQNIGVTLSSPTGTTIQTSAAGVQTAGGRTWNIQTVATVAGVEGWLSADSEYVLRVFSRNLTGNGSAYSLTTSNNW